MPRLEDYQLVRVLAQGGMGVVHEAIERATGRRVALKRVLTGGMDRDAVARFLVEGRALARLEHPAIVRVHALDQAPGGPFMVMDLVPGESLEQVLRREGPLAPEQVTTIARALGDALAHAHAHGVLHRDLKPANVLVTPEGQVKLIDFGLAKLQVDGGSLGHLTRTGELLGTPTFMAPEQADGRPVDARTDVYGLGATLYALLTGRAPFSGPSAIAVLEAVLTRAPAAPSALRPGMPAALDALVLACLAKDPGDRPMDMIAVRALLDAPSSGVGRRTGARWTLALGAAAVGAVVLGAAALAHRAPGSTSSPGRDGHGTREAPSLPADDAAQRALDEAVRRAEETALRARDDVDAWLELARARVRAGDVEGALAAPPGDSPAAAWVAHGRALVSVERFEEALAALGHERLDPDDLEVVLARFEARVGATRVKAGVSMDAVHDTPEAAGLFAALERERSWAEGLFAREGFLLDVHGDVDHARRSAGDLRSLDAGALAARLEAMAAARIGEVEEALERLQSAIEVDRRSAAAHVERAHLLVPRRRFEDAEADLTRALELDPLRALAWFRRSSLRGMTGRHRDAAADAAWHVALLGPAAWRQRVALTPILWLRAGGHLDEALARLEALRAGRVTAELELELGRTRALMGDAAGARAAYERLLRERPPGHLVDFLAAAQALAPPGEDSTGWEELLLASMASVEDAARWTEGAALLRAQGHAGLAGRFAQRAIELGGGPAAQSLRAQLHADAGRLEEALQDWDAVIGPGQAAGPSAVAADMSRDRAATRVGALCERSVVRARVGDLRGALLDALEARGLLPEGHPAQGSLDQVVAALQAELGAIAAIRSAAETALDGDPTTALVRLLESTAHEVEGPRARLLYARVARLLGRAGADTAQMLSLAATFVDDAERLGAPKEDVQELRRRLQADPDALGRADSQDVVMRVRALMELGRYTLAAEQLRPILATDPQPFLVLALATCLRSSGDRQGAVTCYERLLEGEGPFRLLARRALAAQHNEVGDGAGALRRLDGLRTSASLPPAVAAGFASERASALLALGRADEALEAAERAVALVDEALRSAQGPNLIALGGERSRVLATRGQALLRLRRLAEGRAALLEALKLAASLPLEEQHLAKRQVRATALEAVPGDDEVLRWADRAFP